MSMLAAFNDFMTTNRERPLSSVDNLINDSTKYNCYLLRDILEGLTENQYIQDGVSIVEEAQLFAGGSFRMYNPTNPAFAFVPSNTMVKLTVPWRFGLSSAQWTEQEVELAGSTSVTAFKNLKQSKINAALQDGHEGIEDQFLLNAPDVAQMENAITDPSVNGKAYSLHVHLTTDGLAPSSTNGGVVGADWTTVQTVVVSTTPNFKNQFKAYDNTSAATVLATLTAALDSMWQQVQFKSPVSSQQYFRDVMLKKFKILATLVGINKWSEVSRARNDRLGNTFTDLGYLAGEQNYAGIPLQRVGALDVYDVLHDTGAGTSSGGATGNNAAEGGILSPRYRFVNFQTFRPIFHKRHFMTRQQLPPTQQNPFANLLLLNSWFNNFMINRRRNGIVYGAH